jgi:hypothetical protein
MTYLPCCCKGIRAGYLLQVELYNVYLKASELLEEVKKDKSQKGKERINTLKDIFWKRGRLVSDCDYIFCKNDTYRNKEGEDCKPTVEDIFERGREISEELEIFAAEIGVSLPGRNCKNVVQGVENLKLN